MRRRRRSLVLVPAALLSAACTRSRQDDTVAAGGDALSRDLTLATQMENRPVDPARPEAGASSGVCAAQPRPAAPSAQQRQQALSFAQRGQQAEVVGDTRSARDLFARAARLDGTDKDVVYHLARADEALGRTSDAAREYCQYLSLVPGTAGAAEANARLAALGTSSETTTGASASIGAATRATSAWRAPARSRVSYAAPNATGSYQPATSSGAATVAAAPRPQSSATEVRGEAAGHRASSSTDPATDGASSGETAVASADTATSGGAATQAETTTPPAPAAHRPSVGGTPSHVARDATIGAAAGAAVGAVMTHSAKGAGIGAIAGGLLGAVAGRGPGLVRTPGFAR